MKIRLLIFSLVLIQSALFGQEETKSKFTKAIEDNSYFIEEAYNQEDGVVQHISNGYYTLSPSKDFMYSFTQEWPVKTQKHQFSYTLGYSWLNSNAVHGIPDFMINYRYQLTGHDDFLTMSPRFSISLPTGNESKGLGRGAIGYQFNLPMSKRISNGIAFHANAGYTLFPGVKSTDNLGVEHKNTEWTVNLGGSFIWLVSEKFNLMLEGIHYISSSANGSNKMVVSNMSIVSPGLRYAIDVKELQIVPGIAMPITMQNGNTDLGIFFYLSFEHPF